MYNNMQRLFAVRTLSNIELMLGNVYLIIKAKEKVFKHIRKPVTKIMRGFVWVR